MAGETRGVAVVGGGTGGLGRAVVGRLQREGWTVAVPAHHPGRADLPRGVTVARCDLSSAADVDAFAGVVATLGPWRALVSCSGGYAGGNAHEMDDAAIVGQLELNLLGHWRLARAAAAAMVAAGAGGRIVDVVGRAALEPAGGQAAYQVAKAGALRLVQVMALELRGHAISVNAVLPSIMDTPGNRVAMPGSDRSRWVPVERVAGVVAWLLSEEAQDVTGAAVTVYGRA